MSTQEKYRSGIFKEQIILLIYCALLASLVFSMRAISSISIGLLIIAAVIFKTWNFSWKPAYRFLLIVCLLSFLVHASGMLYSTDFNGSLEGIRTKSAIVLVPLALICCPPPKVIITLLARYYCFLLIAAFLVCFFVAVNNYAQTGSSSVFFYHEFAYSISQHAIYLSFLVIVGIVLLMEKSKHSLPPFSGMIKWMMLPILITFLILLSSKIMIGLGMIYFLFTALRKIPAPETGRKKWIFGSLSVVALLAIALQLKSPVSDRFRELLHTDLSVLQQDRYDPADYFDGLQFRLMQWRFTGEILNSESAWLRGVSPGDAQEKLDSLYAAKHMYKGIPGSEDNGYLGYNTHNQFLETTLRSGLVGLVVLAVLWFGMFRIAAGNRLSFITALILFAWSFTESILESQYGLMYFFIPVFFVVVDGDEGQPSARN